MTDSVILHSIDLGDRESVRSVSGGPRSVS